jgi:hypothetical protein
MQLQERAVGVTTITQQARVPAAAAAAAAAAVRSLAVVHCVH